MRSLRNLLLFALPLASSVLAQSQPEPSEEKEVYVDHNQEFRELLASLPEESLHAALHLHLQPKFKDGVFEYNRNAVERVHNDDPPLASKVISAAKLDLIRRQASNATSSAPRPPPPPVSSTLAVVVSQTTVPVTTTNAAGRTTVITEVSQVPVTSAVAPSNQPSPPIVVPIPVTTTNSRGSVIVTQTSSTIPSASVSVAVPVTTTDGQGRTVTTTSSAAAVVLTTTNAAGSSIVTTAPIYNPSTNNGGGIDITTTDSFGNTVILSDVTPGKVITTTDAAGRLFVTTYTPAGAAVSSLVLETTTLPDGQRSTITSFAIVAPPSQTPVGTPTGAAGASGGQSASGTRSPGLQTAAANVLSRRVGVEVAALVGGAVGVAWLV